MRRLRQYATAELGARPEVREAILIGSLARGDWSASSDADVVVLVDRATGAPAARGVEYLPSRPLGIGVDVLVYTPEEAAAWRPRYRDEVARGIVLFRR